MAELIDPSNYQDFTLETLRSPDGITKLNNILRQISQNIAGDTENVRVFQGVGTPEASVAAGVGSLYMRIDGSTDTSIYRKESGSGNTGWVAVTSPASLPLSLANGGTGVALVDPNADRILFWDDSAGQVTFLTVGTGLSISTTTLSSSVPAYTAGDYYINSSDYVGVHPGGNTTPTKVLEMYIPRAGTLRIKFFLGGNAGTCNGQIYRNGSAVGTLRSNLSSAAALYSEDIASWAIGDLCQLYVYNSSSANETYGVGLALYEGTPYDISFNETTYPQRRHYIGAPTPTTIFDNLGNIGDTYSDSGGGASTTLYVKTASTTWTAK